jgi:glutathione S-transferase
MLKLYHYAISTCSQKVRLVLAHKGLQFESQEIDLLGGGQHDPDYVKLNPNHVVPTLIHDGDVFIESSLINEYLEDAFPDVPMMFADPAERHAVRMITKRLDEKVHPVTGIITFAIGPRTILLQQPEEVREANINAIPDPARRAVRRSVIEQGVKAPEFANAISVMLSFMDTINESLDGNNWLSGDSFGLADAAVLPYVLRLDHLAMTPVLEARSNLMAWYQRVQTLPCYELAVNEWLPPPLVELFRRNGQAVWSDVEPFTH